MTLVTLTIIFLFIIVKLFWNNLCYIKSYINKYDFSMNYLKVKILIYVENVHKYAY